MRQGFGILLIPLPWMFTCLLAVSPNSHEGDALSALKSNLSDPHGVLTTWDMPAPPSPKTSSPKAASSALAPPPPPPQHDATIINPCTWFRITCNDDNSVTRVDLGNMGLSGQLVPQLGLLANLQYMGLHSNNISGKIPSELGNLTSLVSLDLYNNTLSGPIPDELGKLSKLRYLRLNDNTLSGTIPMSLTNINSLQELDLSNNNLSGVVPVNGSFSMFTKTSYRGNSHLIFPPQVGPTPGLNGQSKPGNGAPATIALFIPFGFAMLFSAAFIAARVSRGRRKAEDDPEIYLGALHWFTPRALNKFSLSELQVATNNFDPKNIVGHGGFGQVYKGCLADGSLVAVKRLKYVHNKVEELQFQAEVEMISLVVHRNLLRLQGFCLTATEKLLVYPYMTNGSLASCLRGTTKPLLDWPKRKAIALGSARGLAYLHHRCDPKIIHCDVKAANILLDEEFEAVVGDFGLAKLMDCLDTHVATSVCGTMGYIAPEYLSDGKCSEKTDVFGYGVMLLELVSGHKATELGQLAIDDGFRVHNLVKGLVKNKKLERLVDDNFKGNYVEEEVEQIIQVALLCTQSSPKQRPTMSEVVRMLKGKGLEKRWEEWQTQDALCQVSNHSLRQTGGWIVDSTSKLRADELSAPR